MSDDDLILDDASQNERFTREIRDETTIMPDVEDIGAAAGELAGQIIDVLTNSAQEVIGLFQEVIHSVGDVLEEVGESNLIYISVLHTQKNTNS